jgi:hypothetical protein
MHVELKSPMKVSSGNTGRLQLATPGTPDTIAIPNTSAGERPKYAALVINNGSLVAHVAFGGAAVSADAAIDMAILAECTPCIFDVSGFTHVSGVCTGGSVSLLITPLENS